jgi:hypothetical protein
VGGGGGDDWVCSLVTPGRTQEDYGFLTRIHSTFFLDHQEDGRGGGGGWRRGANKEYFKEVFIKAIMFYFLKESNLCMQYAISGRLWKNREKKEMLFDSTGSKFWQEWLDLGGGWRE